MLSAMLAVNNPVRAKTTSHSFHKSDGFVQSVETGLIFSTDELGVFFETTETYEVLGDQSWNGTITLQVSHGVVYLNIDGELENRTFVLFLSEDALPDNELIESWRAVDAEDDGDAIALTETCPGGSCTCSGPNGGNASACCPDGQLAICNCEPPNCCTGKCVKAQKADFVFIQ